MTLPALRLDGADGAAGLLLFLVVLVLSPDFDGEVDFSVTTCVTALPADRLFA